MGLARSEKERRQQYYCSREWGLLKGQVRERCGGICERCRHFPMYAVHHLTYIRLYRERLDDLQGLCDGCHEFVHGKSDRDPMLDLRPKLGTVEIESVYLAGRFGPRNWRRQIMPQWSNLYGHADTGMASTPDCWSAEGDLVYLPDRRHIKYAGPYWIGMVDHDHTYPIGKHAYGENIGHGQIETDREAVMWHCLNSIVGAELVFAWLDSRECFGTLVELGYYRRVSGGILVVAMPEWDHELWFAAHLADRFIIAGSAGLAWERLWSGDCDVVDHYPDEPELSEDESTVDPDGFDWSTGEQITT